MTDKPRPQIWEVFEEVQAARGWSAEEALAQLQANYERFMAPIAERPAPKKSNRERKAERKRADLYESEEEGARDSKA